MELTTAHLFVFLLLALVLCSFFGGSCEFDNGLSLEGFHNDSPYHGKGQYSDRYKNYATMYRDHAKKHGTFKSLLSTSDETEDAVTKKYAPYKHGKRTNGIRANQILRGNEDLYILKSEVVPPVCPACPASKAGSDTAASKCPPCPPCARCPEPAFECKKVPNYNRTNDDTMPYPVLNSFSQFGL